MRVGENKWRNEWVNEGVNEKTRNAAIQPIRIYKTYQSAVRANTCERVNVLKNPGCNLQYPGMSANSINQG